MVNNEESCVRQLAGEISMAIRSTPDVLQDKFIEVPELSTAIFDAPEQDASSSLPYAYRHLSNLQVSSPTGLVERIFSLFRSVEHSLIWGHAPGYSRDNVGQEFLDNYCHALLSGPDGPLRCASPLGAFVLFGPNTLYRDHSHAPNEVYLALSGGAQWRVGDYGWRELQAGNTIFIPSHAVHAIQTYTQPLLAFSFWLEAGDMEAIKI